MLVPTGGGPADVALERPWQLNQRAFARCRGVGAGHVHWGEGPSGDASPRTSPPWTGQSVLMPLEPPWNHVPAQPQPVHRGIPQVSLIRTAGAVPSINLVGLPLADRAHLLLGRAVWNDYGVGLPPHPGARGGLRYDADKATGRQGDRAGFPLRVHGAVSWPCPGRVLAASWYRRLLYK